MRKPGTRGWRGNNNAAGWQAAMRRKEHDQAKAQANLEADLRRADVYRTDVPFTGDEKTTPLPRKGTPQRAELVQRVIELRGTGLTHLQIACELNIDCGIVSVLIKEGKQL